MIGINATPDDVNRLAVMSDASLFSNAGNGHQIKLNKAAATDAGTLLFQTAWSGRAEMGLAGSDDFSIKVSGDGSNWLPALSISADGVVRTPARPLARASLAAGIATPAAASRTGFDTFHARQGGFALGAAVPSGTGNRLLVPATGFYLLSLTVSTLTSSGHGTAIEVNGTTILAAVSGPASTVPTNQTAVTAAQLSKGDWLALMHTGTAQNALGAAKTELSAVML
jgi:hypothetical protein